MSSNRSSPQKQLSPAFQNGDHSNYTDTLAVAGTIRPPPVLRPSRSCTLRSSPVQATEEPEKNEQPSQPSQLQNNDDPLELMRSNLRSMSELSSILNFLHVFRTLLNIKVEFSAEELEVALITPNDMLNEIHIPILKEVPPVTRTALTHANWVTVLCKKLKDWWQWVADGDLPMVASQGSEVELYKSLDPAVRVVILKALCDIRVEQDDIRDFMDDALKNGAQLSAFRKEPIGGDSNGVTYWYEDDPVAGYRLYREVRKFEGKRSRSKGSEIISKSSCQWETIATNFEEFQDVSEKLFKSSNEPETSLGSRLKNDMLPEIEKEHKRKEKRLKRQQRQSLFANNLVLAKPFATGRTLRDRKPVTYTFDDYDRTISEAIKTTKYDNLDQDDVIIGEETFDDVKKHKRRGIWSGSEEDEEYREGEDTDAEDEEQEGTSSFDKRSLKPQQPSRRELRSVELQPGLRRSKRPTTNCFSYNQLTAESERNLGKHEKSANQSDENGCSSGSLKVDTSALDRDCDHEHDQETMVVDGYTETVTEKSHPPDISDNPGHNEVEGDKNICFIDLD